MPHNMKSVMIISPNDSDEKTANQFIGWLRDNKRIDNVPNAAKTRKYLDSLELK